jgi:hypothetical protein
VVEGEFESVVEREFEMSVRRDLLEVIDWEYERIASIYRDINKSCLDVDLVRVHPHIEVHDFQRVENGLPAVRSVEFIFSGDRVVRIDSWRYDVVVVGDRHDHVIGIIEVVMFGDRCFIMKDVDEYELEYAVRDIVSDLLKESSEEELKDG